MKKSNGQKPTTRDLRDSMFAVVTKGNGGYEKLVYTSVPIPEIGGGEVLINVLAAGMNNTEINTRLGWYSDSVTDSTDSLSNSELGKDGLKADGGWNETTPFPLIQGTDCCGKVVATIENENHHLLDKRVLVRACMRKHGFSSMENIWMASDFDGAFAQYVKVPASEVFVVDCDWSDAELATIPCAYGTAENMIARASVTDQDCVLITGASGGVGSAAVQLVKRRGATVVAIVSANKIRRVKQLGADKVISRDTLSTTALDGLTFDVAIDNVAGQNFAEILKLIRRGGRYVSSGAIAGPLVSLDMRDFYLKDITMIGCTAWDESTFPNLISYIENSEIKPLLAKTFPLHEIVAAQQAFLQKKHIGNFVLIPPKV